MDFLMKWLRRDPHPPEGEEPELVWIEVKDHVEVNGRPGRVQTISLSPYWGEEQEGIVRAYVVGNGWADWCLAEELVLIKKADAQLVQAVA